MERPSLTVDFGVSRFQVLDVWPTTRPDPIQLHPVGIDNGASYLSFPLTDEQKAFLGNTKATHIRLEMREVK